MASQRNPNDEDGEEWVHFSMRLPPSLHEKATAKAREDDRSLASAVRRLMVVWVGGHPGF